MVPTGNIGTSTRTEYSVQTGPSQASRLSRLTAWPLPNGRDCTTSLKMLQQGPAWSRPLQAPSGVAQPLQPNAQRGGVGVQGPASIQYEAIPTPSCFPARVPPGPGVHRDTPNETFKYCNGRKLEGTLPPSGACLRARPMQTVSVSALHLNPFRAVGALRIENVSGPIAYYCFRACLLGLVVDVRDALVIAWAPEATHGSMCRARFSCLVLGGMALHALLRLLGQRDKTSSRKESGGNTAERCR